jgi:hypothetical protein
VPDSRHEFERAQTQKKNAAFFYAVRTWRVFVEPIFAQFEATVFGGFSALNTLPSRCLISMIDRRELFAQTLASAKPANLHLPQVPCHR